MGREELEQRGETALQATHAAHPIRRRRPLASRDGSDWAVEIVETAATVRRRHANQGRSTWNVYKQVTY